MRVVLVLLVLTVLVVVNEGKVFSRCALVKRLRQLGANRNQIATWVCIAKGESSYDTAAINHHNTDNSKDYGIFQINNRYWCDRVVYYYLQFSKYF
jgi:lysozyme C